MAGDRSGVPGPRPRRFAVSLLTDYGLEDGFVGALHSVILTRAPEALVVDLAHGIKPGDVRGGSQALLRAVPYLAPGAVVAVVDPGVGTARRAVAVATPKVTLGPAGTGPSGSRPTDAGPTGVRPNPARGGGIVFIGPDNGLLVPAVEAAGGPSLAVELEDRGYWLPAPGPTFAGRDIFAPAAAQLARGWDIEDLGRLLEPATLVRIPAPVREETGAGRLKVEVTWLDRYGNVQLAARPEDFEGLRGEPLVVRVLGQAHPADRAGDGPWPVKRASTFGELSCGELGLLVDSYGYLALVLDSASAAEMMAVQEGDIVELSAPPLGPSD